MNYWYLIFAVLFTLLSYLVVVLWRNCDLYSQEACAVGNLLMSIKSQDVESDDAAAARVLNMTPDQYKTEREKGRILFHAGTKVCGIANGLKAPIRLWR